MKKILLLLIMSFLGVQAQGQRYGVVDTEYILSQMPEYTQAQAQLDKLSKQWEGEVSALFSEAQSLKDALAAERILLSPGQIEEREKAISAKESEALALQQKYFGPEGELFKKRMQLVKPLQDKVFNAIRAVAIKRKLDLVLDKSSSVTVLYVSKAADYSEEVLDKLKER